MEGTVFAGIIECLLLPDQGPPRATYDDRTILLVAMWAVVHDRPMNRATQAAN